MFKRISLQVDGLKQGGVRGGAREVGASEPEKEGARAALILTGSARRRGGSGSAKSNCARGSHASRPPGPRSAGPAALRLFTFDY